jgi:hypothetical protein
MLCFNIIGYNFGGEFVENDRSLVNATIAGTPCVAILAVNHTALVCCSNVTAGLAVVTVAGQVSQGRVLTNDVSACSIFLVLPATVSVLPLPCSLVDRATVTAVLCRPLPGFGRGT